MAMNLATYLIGSQLAIALLYILYKALWGNDTFLPLHRATIVTGIIFALTYPLLPYIPSLSVNSLLPYDDRLSVMLDAITITPDTSTTTFSNTLTWLYWTVVAIGFARLVIRLCSLFVLRHRCTTTTIEGSQVLLTPSEGSPFSFFKFIFIPQTNYSPDMLHHIICHEKTHVSQRHTFDILLGEIAIIIGWFNPFAWLLRSEIRLYTEQLADAAAIQTATSPQQYQLHLLQASNDNKYPFSSFGKHSLLARIKMLNRNSSPHYRKLYYIITLPLAALLVTGLQACKKQPSEQLTATNIIHQISTEIIYDTCEIMPQFPGGEKAMMDFIASNLKYPQQAIKDNVEGAVLAEFIINAEGKVIEPRIVNSLTPECDNEVIRVINLMPAWTPGQQDNMAVNVKFALPIMFMLQ